MPTRSNDGPKAVVQRQLDAYDDGDVDRFVDSFAPDAVIQPLLGDDDPTVGHEAIRADYGPLFEEHPTLRCEAIDWLVVGDTVAVHERPFVEDEQVSESVAVDRVEAGRVTHLWSTGE